MLRKVSFSADSNAPFNVVPAELAEFEAREDASTLSTAMGEARKENNLHFLKVLQSRFNYVRRAWMALKVADNRRKYSARARKPQLQGQQPPRGESKVSNHCVELRARHSNAPMADQALKHTLRTWDELNADENPGRYIDLLVPYLNRRSKLDLDIWEEETEDKDDDKEEEEVTDNEGNSDGDRKGEDTIGIATMAAAIRSRKRTRLPVDASFVTST